jgi:ankyrin repeat protein
VKLLLESAADVNAIQMDGQTPLHLACEKGHLDIAQLLLESAADFNAVNKDGFSSLHLACHEGHRHVHGQAQAARGEAPG